MGVSLLGGRDVPVDRPQMRADIGGERRDGRGVESGGVVAATWWASTAQERGRPPRSSAHSAAARFEQIRLSPRTRGARQAARTR